MQRPGGRRRKKTKKQTWETYLEVSRQIQGEMKNRADPTLGKLALSTYRQPAPQLKVPPPSQPILFKTQLPHWGVGGWVLKKSWIVKY